MNILEIAGDKVTLEIWGQELNQLADIARLAEAVANAAPSDEVQDVVPEYLLQRAEGLSLTIGLWKNLLELANTVADNHLTFSAHQYQTLNIVGSREQKAAEAAHRMAADQYPDAHANAVKSAQRGGERATG